ncbi:type I pullulanase [Macrococcus hajekii]|uniref:Type I pullulanase n=1 Tax=Macrococcus hajekii TaxID=198482 RepID=A0A4V3BE99_9STAP|nr:type I pullulanase [Macrococcus hajekii]TDM03255.1 type I pullulanase [Macrococcus hajekii]GGA97349.1 pullulanase [Macrococcus hajekii]
MFTGYIDSFNTISLDDKNQLNGPFMLVSEDTRLSLSPVESEQSIKTFSTSQSIRLNTHWWIEAESMKIPVKLGKVVRTQDFDEQFSKNHEEYGAIYSRQSTRFTVWSPVAKRIRLHLNDRLYDMSYREGDWTIEIDGDWHLAHYCYEVEVNHEIFQVVDPYAKGLTLNSTRGVVVDPAAAPEGFTSHTRPVLPPADSIIYEVHVRDFSMHPNSGIPEYLKGKFAALTVEDSSTKRGYSTGFDYIRSLGITHVELLPINDFAKVDDVNFKSSYNWGYDPLYFQTLDGSFSVDPAAPECRIHELKHLVKAYHEAGLGIILDVVFNHVFDQPSSSFEQLVPGYFFRYYDDLSLSNGTGVGNDFASERQMARKFILDTLKYYNENFQVDGFRFDLMGAIDVETMTQVNQLLTAINPNVLLLGEGWHLNTAIPDVMKTTHDQAYRIPHLHFFNDYFRDTLKGNNFDIADTGFINGRGRYRERMFKLFQGDYGLPVSQTINYTEVHDNHTLYDRLSYTAKNSDFVMKQHQMITIFTLLSQGIPFLHAGQEFYRTKYGHGNTYNLSDFINRIDWNRRIKYNEDIEIIKQAISLRKQYEIFRLTDPLAIKTRIIEVSTPSLVLGVLLFDYHDEFLIYFNPTALNQTIELPRQGVFIIELSNSHSTGSVQSSFNLSPFECIVLRKTIY